MTINLLKGLSIAHISLPIRIFDTRSSIQRIVSLWSYTKTHLKNAVNTKDPIERIKWVLCFGICGLYLQLNQRKPFNPLLGETNQGSFEDGTRYYLEHTSHHPPISHFLLEGPNKSYRMYGYYEFCGSFGANSFVSGLRGPCTIEFADGNTLRFNGPDFKIGGSMYGDRTVEPTGSIVI